MTPSTILILIIVYFGILFYISHSVSKKDSGNDAFFKANKNSKWYLVAFGMIGTALSGVTFISVPGEVGSPNGEQFKYFQFVLGNAIGFVLIAKVLLPLYYRMNLTSIYGYIEHRLGIYSYKTAATIFLISRTIGSAFRLYLVVIVLHRYVFDFYGVPFAFTVLISLALIFAYTYRGGLKTIIITDTLQTFFLVTSVFMTIFFICKSLNLNIFEAFGTVKNSNYSKVFFFEDLITSKFHFAKQILGGIIVSIAMVGLDQYLMQKNLSCKNIGEAQKNMFTFTGIFVLINIFFLSVGALLYIYAAKNGIEVPTDLVTGKPRTDLLFPEIAFNHLTLIPSIIASPLSALYIPDRTLSNVDFPAPLEPTIPYIQPSAILQVTLSSAVKSSNDLVTPFTSIIFSYKPPQSYLLSHSYSPLRMQAFLQSP